MQIQFGRVAPFLFLDIDLNLLKIFVAMLDERHVSRAAKKLRLTQPAVSMGLARLRDLFDDELFVRSNRDMIPTDKASRLGPKIREALSLIHDSLGDQVAFDPADATGDIRISVDDYLAQVLVLPVMKKALSLAPNLRIELVALRDRDPNRDLQFDLDFAIRAIQKVNPNLYSKRLLTEDYRVLVSPSHTRVKTALSLKDYTQLEHVLVSPFGGFNGTVDDALAEKGLHRNVRWSVGHFALGPMFMKDSDYILTLPSSIAAIYEQQYQLKSFLPPLKMPVFHVYLYWHERIHRSPMHSWFRSLF